MALRFTIPLLAAVVLAGCAKQQPPTTVSLRDDAHLFDKKRTPRLLNQLNTLSNEKQIAIVLRTIPESKVPAIALSSYFDQVFETDPEWLPIATHASWWQFGRKTNPPENGLEVIVLRKPSFLAWRFGKEARWRAFVSGVMISNSTLQMQRRAQTGDVQGALDALLQDFHKDLPAPKDLSRLQRFAVSEYAPEVQEFINSATVNGWEWYNRYALRPVLQLQFSLSKYVWPQQAQLLAVVASLLAAQVVLWVFRKVLNVHWAGKFVAVAVSIAVEALAITPSIGSLLLLAHGRLEDQMFVGALLDQSDSKVSQFLNSGSALNFVGQTGIWIALLLAIAGVISSFVNSFFIFYASSFPNEVQKRMYDSLDPAETAFLYLTGYDEDANVENLGEKPDPYTEVAGGLFIKMVKGYFGRIVVFAIMPLGASLVLAKRSIVSVVMNAWPLYKTYKLCKEIDRTAASSAESSAKADARGA